jgi:FMN reductase
MTNGVPHVLLVSGSLGEKSSTRFALQRFEKLLQEKNVTTDFWDLRLEPLAIMNPETTYSSPEYSAWKSRAERADVFVLATPDYHGSMSGALKNFLDHFWKEYSGKLFTSIVGSYEKGLTVADQIRTVARQCYAWSVPYSVSFHEKADFNELMEPTSELDNRLRMLSQDVVVYGRLLAEQREKDLAGTDPGFMARYRK